MIIMMKKCLLTSKVSPEAPPPDSLLIAKELSAGRLSG